MSKASHGYVSSLLWRSESRLQVVHSALPSGLLSDSELPFAYDWRAVNGHSFVTADANQHLPQPCGSSWVHATAAALDDRIKIARRAKAPDVQLSRQALLNCVPGPRASPPPGCNGGDAWMVHEYLEHSVVPDQTCQPYTARNGACEPMGQCRSCPPWAAGASASPACLSLAAPSYVGYGVAEYGSVRGELAMMKEILLRGPIVCSLVAGPRFVSNYTAVAARHEGIYVGLHDEGVYDADANHEVEISGWGVSKAGGLPYWVLRNSWGAAWGDKGWAHLRRGANELRVESACSWAVPRLEDELALTPPTMRPSEPDGEGEEVEEGEREEGEEGEEGEEEGEEAGEAAAALGTARPSSPVTRNGQAGASASSAASPEQPPDADGPGVARDAQADGYPEASRDLEGSYEEHAEHAERSHVQEAHVQEARSSSSSTSSGGSSSSSISSGSSSSSISSGSSSTSSRGVEAIAVDHTTVGGAERLGGATSAARVPFVSALLLAAVGLTTVSAAMLSLYRGGPVGAQVGLACDRESPASNAAAELDALRANYVPPPFQLFSSPSFEDYRPLGASPPTRWKVPL